MLAAISILGLLCVAGLIYNINQAVELSQVEQQLKSSRALRPFLVETTDQFPSHVILLLMDYFTLLYPSSSDMRDMHGLLEFPKQEFGDN